MVTLSQLSDVLYLDTSSPSGLRWKVDIKSGRNKVQVHADSIAGCLMKQGYWIVKYKCKTYPCHRIVWSLTNNCDIPAKLQIDHIDGDRANNCISNLRLVTQTVNSRNKRKRPTNSSGKTGVSIMERSSYTLYIARWRDMDGREKSKSFNSAKHPDAYRMACEYRDFMLQSLNELGAGYAPKHGEREGVSYGYKE
jgi:hypothetical protein